MRRRRSADGVLLCPVQGTGKGKRLRPLAPQEAGSAGASVGEHAGGAPADAAPVRTPASEVKHPLETGTRVDTRWRDGSYHQCRILEKRPSAAWEGPSDHPYAWEYYVHYRRSEQLPACHQPPSG